MKILLASLFLAFSLMASADQLCGNQGMAFSGLKKCMAKGMMVRRTDIMSTEKFKIVEFAPNYPGGDRVIIQTGTKHRYKNFWTKGGYWPEGTEPIPRDYLMP
jgi:hypothetical protein